MIRNSEKTNTHYQKNSRAKKKLHNILGLFLPVQEWGKYFQSIKLLILGSVILLITSVCFFRIPYHAVLLGRPVYLPVCLIASAVCLDNEIAIV